MKHITLSKIPGESYKASSFKVYGISRNGQSVGTLEQDFGGRWEVLNAHLERVSVHTTIKAAVRVAGRVL